LLKTEVLGNKLQAKRNTDPYLDQEKGLDPTGPGSGSGINTAFQNHQITLESWNVLSLETKNSWHETKLKNKVDHQQAIEYWRIHRPKLATGQQTFCHGSLNP
jgi:hypothetical protein